MTTDGILSLDHQDLRALEEIRMARKTTSPPNSREWFMITYHVVGLHGEPTEDMLFKLKAAHLFSEQPDLEQPEHPYNVFLAFLEACGMFTGEPRSTHPVFIWEQAQEYFGDQFLEGLRIAFFRTLDFYATPAALHAAMTPHTP